MTRVAVFRVRRPDGSIKIDLTKRLCRSLGSVETGTTNGSITHPGFAQGNPRWQILSTSGDMAGCYAPKVAVDGTVLSWNFDAAYNQTRQNCIIRYGVY